MQNIWNSKKQTFYVCKLCPDHKEGFETTDIIDLKKHLKNFHKIDKMRSSGVIYFNTYRKKIIKPLNPLFFYPQFPHIPEQIFKNLDKESIRNCRKVSKSMKEAIDDRICKKCLHPRRPNIHFCEKKIFYSCKLCADPRQVLGPFQVENTDILKQHMIQIHWVDENGTNWDKYFKACELKILTVRLG